MKAVPLDIRIEPAPSYVGEYWLVDRTDVFVRYRGRDYGSRVNYPIDDTPANRNSEAQAFLRRRARFA